MLNTSPAHRKPDIEKIIDYSYDGLMILNSLLTTKLKNTDEPSVTSRTFTIIDTMHAELIQILVQNPISSL